MRVGLGLVLITFFGLGACLEQEGASCGVETLVLGWDPKGADAVCGRRCPWGLASICPQGSSLIVGPFLFFSEEMPYLKCPLHTVLKLTPVAYGECSD